MTRICFKGEASVPLPSSSSHSPSLSSFFFKKIYKISPFILYLSLLLPSLKNTEGKSVLSLLLQKYLR
jgi:hypothetical protein